MKKKKTKKNEKQIQEVKANQIPKKKTKETKPLNTYHTRGHMQK